MLNVIFKFKLINVKKIRKIRVVCRKCGVATFLSNERQQCNNLPFTGTRTTVGLSDHTGRTGDIKGPSGIRIHFHFSICVGTDLAPNMNTVLFLLAATTIFTVSAGPAGGPPDPCLLQCKNATYAKLGAHPLLSKLTPGKLTSPETRAKFRAALKAYITGTGTGLPPAVGNVETWAKLCTIATEAETCVEACPDSPHRQGVKKMLTVAKLGCDEDFKSSIGCLVDVSKEPSEECQTKCGPLAAKLKEHIDQRDANPSAPHTAPPKDVVESGCKFTNCRLNCRKSVIVNKCQDKGFQVSKKLTKALATASKISYKKHGGDISNWPEICEAEKITQPTA